MRNTRLAYISVTFETRSIGQENCPKNGSSKSPRLISIGVGILLCALATIPAPAQTFKQLLDFDISNGAFPNSIVQGPDGRLWGTTSEGGNSNCGKVFKMTPAGALSMVFSFNCVKGSNPQGLTLGTDGNFYGATFFGGPGHGGTIFRLTSTGKLTVLFNFTLDGSSGSAPVGRLVQGTDGSFYGATYSGGLSDSYGTVFKITPDGTLTTLYAFDFTHGSQPQSGLLQGNDGNFYGTTYSGGAHGVGTVFKITPKGSLTVLYSFGASTSDGSYPVTSLVYGRDGDFYGTTPYGGPDNDGTIFKITPGGVYKTLHSFAETDGRFPYGLMQATNGYFYGTTANGGVNDTDGLLFKMTPVGSVTTLHSFNGSDGTYPQMLIQDTSGSLFGITSGGGNLECNPTYGCGTVFSLSLGLGPFIETDPASGKVGALVTILGTNLTGATGVTFNGTPAPFTVVSSSEIATTIPTGASSGKIKVVTPSLTLSTSGPFRVTK